MKHLWWMIPLSVVAAGVVTMGLVVSNLRVPKLTRPSPVEDEA